MNVHMYNIQNHKILSFLGILIIGNCLAEIKKKSMPSEGSTSNSGIKSQIFIVLHIQSHLGAVQFE